MTRHPDRIAADTVWFGIGNSGRGDDGLGWVFLDRIQREPEFAGRAEYRYQLQVEDAALVRDAQQVIFIDACREPLPGGFRWIGCKPSSKFEFTSHVLPPAAVLCYCRDLFGSLPRARLLVIEGTDWRLREGLSAQASANLEAAIRFIKDKRRLPEFA